MDINYNLKLHINRNGKFIIDVPVAVWKYEHIHFISLSKLLFTNELRILNDVFEIYERCSLLFFMDGLVCISKL